MSANDVMKRSPVEELAEEIINKRTQNLQNKIKAYRRSNPILSDISDCDRQVVYSVLNWKDRPLHDADLQARFDVGNIWEREIIRELQNLGYEFILSQQPMEIKGRNGKLLATGRVDGFIKQDRERIPVEIKSMNPNIYDQIDTLEDFRRKPWLRKYLRQIQLYMFGNNIEYGIFILTDALGHWKAFPVYLDYGECEHLLQRLERIAESIQNEVYPDRIPYSSDHCGRCPFAHICLPDIERSEAQILTSETIISQLEEREKLAPAKKKYDEIDRSIKKSVSGIEKGIAGDFMIQGKTVHKKAYEVPESDYWQVRIKRIGEKPRSVD